LLSKAFYSDEIKTNADFVTDLCLGTDLELRKLKSGSGSTAILVYADPSAYLCYQCGEKLRHFGSFCNTKKCPNRDEYDTPSSDESTDESKEEAKEEEETEALKTSERDILVANIGDSRCMILHLDGTFTTMSDDHKPTNPIEKKRIEDSGSVISNGRINGDINVSRSFGDFTHKKGPIQAVSVVPDFKNLRMLETDLLLICCDGIMERFDRQFLADFIFQQKTRENLGKLCKKICMKAYLKGSSDNLTCIVVKFGPRNEFMYDDHCPQIEIKYYGEHFGNDHCNVFNQSKIELKPIVDEIKANPKKRKS